MADYFVWSGTGGASAPYANWQTASATLATAGAAAGAGDTIYIADDHSETAAGQNLAFTASTYASPIKILCVTRNGTTGTANTGLSTGALVRSSTTTFVVNNSIYVYGVTFDQTSNSATSIVFTGTSVLSTQVLDNCSFILTGTGTGSRIQFGNSQSATTCVKVILKNPRFKFASVQQLVELNNHVSIYGGSIISGGSAGTSIFCAGAQARGGSVDINGFDFTNCSASVVLFSGSGGSTTYSARLRNCKLPTSWSGSPLGNPGSGGNHVELYNYGITGVTGSNYKFWTVDVFGTNKEETTIYRTAGAQDEATPYSIKMVTTTNTSWPGHVLRSPPIIQRVEAGASITDVLVHIVHDGASAYTNREAWIEVEALGTADYPLSTFYSDACALQSSAAAQPSTGEAWTGDTGTGPNGSSTWNQLQLNTTISAVTTGYVIATVCVAKPSTGGTTGTIYVDPKLVLS